MSFVFFFSETQNTITSELNTACFARKMRRARPLAGFWRTLPYLLQALLPKKNQESTTCTDAIGDAGVGSPALAY